MLGLIGWIGRIILILLIIRLIVSFFTGGKKKRARASESADPRNAGGRRPQPEKLAAKLVRDPQCGTYVAETGAVTASHAGATLHFCSEQCRDQYLASPRATAV